MHAYSLSIHCCTNKQMNEKERVDIYSIKKNIWSKRHFKMKISNICYRKGQSCKADLEGKFYIENNLL